MFIKNKKISVNNKPFIIAEISGNHKGSLKRAFKIIRAAHKSGVSAVKLQTFDLDEMTINSKKRTLLLVIQRVYGTKKSYMIFTKLPRLQKNGTIQFLNCVRN